MKTQLKNTKSRNPISPIVEEADNYFKMISNSTVEGLLLHKNGIALEVNEPMLKLFGYSRKQLIGKNMVDLLPIEEDKSKVAEHVNSASTEPYQARGMKKNGEVFDAEIVGKNVTFEGEDYRVVSIRDVSEKVAAEKALLESERKFKALIEALPDVIMVVNMKGKVVYANDQLNAQTGYHPDDLQFGKYNPLIYPEDRAGFQANLETVKKGKKKSTKTFEGRYISVSGEIIWYSTILSAIEFKGLAAIQIVSRNITETKNYELELQQHKNRLQDLVSDRTKEINQLNKDLQNSNDELTILNDAISRQNIDLKTLLSQLKSTQRQLIDSEKLASVGKLTEGLAHELNNPINWIGGVLRPMQQNLEELKEIIRSDNAEEIFSEMNELFESIRLGTNKISNIVKTLSDITPKGKAAEDSIIELSELIYSNVYTLESRYPEVTFTVDIEEDIRVKARAIDIQQVFFNVMKNAADAVENTSGNVIARIYSDAGSLKCNVKDDGPGIPNDIQNDIYEPFFTTKEGAGYLGLGLYIVKSIVSKYNGSIYLDSIIGRGSEFSFTLPDIVK